MKISVPITLAFGLLLNSGLVIVVPPFVGFCGSSLADQMWKISIIFVADVLDDLVIWKETEG